MAVKVQFRRGTAAEWSAANPVLAQGEAGYEHDTGKFKIVHVVIIILLIVIILISLRVIFVRN